MSFAPGTAVKVRDDWPELRGPVHIRTPHYVRGREGRIVKSMGRFRNPEQLAFSRPAELRELYHVAFDYAALWAEGKPGTVLMVEIYENWLEPL